MTRGLCEVTETDVTSIRLLKKINRTNLLNFGLIIKLGA